VRQALSRRSLIALTLICLLGSCTADVGVLSTARADYTITWCQSEVGDPPFVSGERKYSAIEDHCGASPHVVYLDGSRYKALSGEYEGMLSVGFYRETVTAPLGITITGTKTTLASETQKSGSSVFIEAGDDAGSLYSQEISRQSTTTANVDLTFPSGNTTAWLGEFCSPNQNVSCFFASAEHILTVASFSITLHDDEQPSLYLTGGQLLLAGSHSGTEHVGFSASARISGVAEVDAYLGATLVGRDAYQTTQCSYSRWNPCPQSVTDSVPVDTTKVQDGSYTLVLDAYDASGNVVGVPWSAPITVANSVSPAGSSQGAGASSHGSGAPNGHSATTKAQITYLNVQRGQITVTDGQATNVSGKLTDQTGTPLPGATVDLLGQTVGSSAAFAILGHASTDANGVYTFRVPPGPSRVIRTGYRAFANDIGYDATADLTESVTATTSLSVTPKRLRGRIFTFQGQIHAGDFPPRQQVEIQALIGRAWSHVTFARVTSNGRFKVRYRLKHHYHHVTFVFRAIPVASPVWPYEAQPSNLARLHLL
jgi:hypothetical protein